MVPNPQTQSMSGAYGASVAQSAGVENPLFYDFMEALPPASVTGMWNMGRVSNTMMRGRNARYGTGGGGIRQTLSPFRFRSFADVGNIDPVAAGLTRSGKVSNPDFTRSKRSMPDFRRSSKAAGGPKYGPDLPKQKRRIKGEVTGYTPMQVLSRGADGFAKEGTLRYKATRGKAVGAFGLDGPLTGSQQAFSPGTLGRITASARGGALRSEAKQAKLLSSVSKFDQGVADRAAGVLRSGSSQKAQAMKTAVGATNKGLVSGKITGFIHGMEAGDKAIGTARLVAGNGTAYGKGLTAGANFAASGTRLARFGATGVVSGASRAVPVVGQILLARDLAKFSGKMVGRGINLSIQAGRSAMGDLNNQSSFGMGYQDNSVAATSRARGVAAISNSRLNMRSVLGNEAGYLAASMG